MIFEEFLSYAFYKVPWIKFDEIIECLSYKFLLPVKSKAPKFINIRCVSKRRNISITLLPTIFCFTLQAIVAISFTSLGKCGRHCSVMFVQPLYFVFLPNIQSWKIFPQVNLSQDLYYFICIYLLLSSILIGIIFFLSLYIG